MTEQGGRIEIMRQTTGLGSLLPVTVDQVRGGAEGGRTGGSGGDLITGGHNTIKFL